MEDIDLAKLTKEEEEILELTAELWNRFLALPIYHLMEQSEMQSKIHDIQRMIISRPGFRMNKEKFRDIRSLASLCVHVWLWCLGMPLSRKPKISWY